MESEGGLTHLDNDGSAHMVDVSEKEVTLRVARAYCRVDMKPSTIEAITGKSIGKGDVLTVAKIAGITAAKKTAELIPLCHPLMLEKIDIEFKPDFERGALEIVSTVGVTARTGAEMEALEAVAQTALTVYDMCKSIDREMVIGEIKLLEKRGGKSGWWKRK